MRTPVRPWAVMVEIVGWLGAAVTTVLGLAITVATIQICRELARLEGNHGGYGVNLLIGIVAVAVVAVLWFASVVLIVGGRHWRRRRHVPPTTGIDEILNYRP